MVTNNKLGEVEINSLPKMGVVVKNKEVYSSIGPCLENEEKEDS